MNMMFNISKDNIIKDVNNFKETLCRTREQAGKEVVVFVEQQNDLM